MPAWVAITTADIEARMAAPLMAAIREQYTESGGDPMAVVIADITLRVRGAVATCDQYSVDATETLIPPELRDDAAWLVVHSLMLRLPDATPVPESIVERVKGAEKRLEMVAACKFGVSSPATPTVSTLQTIGGVSVVRTRPQLTGRAGNAGLL